jgi:hypothetical protein
MSSRSTSDPPRRWPHRLALGACLALYLTVSLRHLAVVPPVYEDEPWQASTGVKLARTGVFGSDLFRGLWGSERRHYWFMPLHPLLLAATYRIAGFGLLQTRLEPVALGAATLLLTYGLGRRLFGPAVGVAAVAALLLVRTAGVTRSQVTGILFVDLSRIARYDALVPVLGLAALHVYLSADRRGDWRLHAAAGALAALAGLAHLYGTFWIVALGVLAVWNRSGPRALAALAAGFAVPWCAYLAYVLGDVGDWVAQTRGYAPRFGLADPRWYWHNLLAEPHRYGPGLGPFGPAWALRPGFWTAAALLPASLAALARRALGGDRSARAVVVPAVALPLLFALLITSKVANYLLTVAPVAALAAGWGIVRAWRWAHARQMLAVRVALAAVCLAVGAEAGSREVALEHAAARTTPYATFIARVRREIPAGSRVLGQHSFWFGLEGFDFRSVDVPLLLSEARADAPHRSAAEILDRIAPDVVLLDDRLRSYLDTAPASDPFPADFRNWMAHRHFALSATVRDRTYGTMEVWCRR